MTIKNLTPHSITNVLTGEIFPASGDVARASSASVEVAPGFFATTFGEVTGLPAQEEGVVLLVSMLVRTASGRADLVSPGDLVRDENGNPLGCKGFSVNPGFSV
jgi:hypothetical protein